MDNADFLKASFGEIASFIDGRPEENHTLEFKRKAVASAPDLSKEDRKNLGEAVSGFANATGGVLLLGVATERDHDIDRAKAVDAISNVTSVAARVRSYLNDCVAPPVENVQVRAVGDEDGTGLIVISVPRGQSRPHMSTAPGHHTYYRRVMDAFVPMEAYEVEEMMRLKSEPLLRFVYQVRPAGSTGGNRSFGLLFGLENDSKVTARFPYISYRRPTNAPAVAEYGLSGNGPDLWPRIQDVASGGVLFAAGAGQVLHPAQKLFVSKLDYYEAFDSRFARWAVSNLEDNEALELPFQFGCEDAPMKEIIIKLTRNELLVS